MEATVSFSGPGMAFNVIRRSRGKIIQIFVLLKKLISLLFRKIVILWGGDILVF
jgi:hypothetical protein